MRTPRLSVVAPCYNEAAVLSELHGRISRACRLVTADYEIVLVNDGSSDNSWPLLLCMAAEDPRVVAVNLSRNYGHQMALTAGLSYAAGERILIIDADLQDPPELLPQMMALMDQDADVVYGKRRSRAGETLFKRSTAYLFYRLLNWLTEQDLPSDTGDFRLISRRVLDVFHAMPEKHRFIRGMIAWVGFRQVPLLYDREPRLAGETKYTLRKMLHFALDAITSFSVKPLRLAFYSGGLLCALSLALMAYSIFAYFAHETIRGWTSMVALMLFFLAAQFVFLGLIGEYVGRLYMEAKHRPLFVVEEVAASGCSAADVRAREAVAGKP